MYSTKNPDIHLSLAGGGLDACVSINSSHLSRLANLPKIN